MSTHVSSWPSAKSLLHSCGYILHVNLKPATNVCLSLPLSLTIFSLSPSLFPLFLFLSACVDVCVVFLLVSILLINLTVNTFK